MRKGEKPSPQQGWMLAAVELARSNPQAHGNILPKEDVREVESAADAVADACRLPGEERTG